jgi:hypothetical protein
MCQEFFKSRKRELVHLYNVLGDDLPPIFKLYVELVKRADAVTHKFTFSVDDLAQQLHKDRDKLDTKLIKLANLNMIFIKTGYKDGSKRTITLRVY